MITKPKEKNDLPFEDELKNGQSKDIPVDSKENEPQNVRVDFQDEDLASEYASQQTKPSKDNINPNTSADDIQKQVLDYENSKSDKLEHKDLLQYATWIMNVIDISLSTALSWFSKDTARTAYSLEDAQKKILAQQLAFILSKYQSKFKIEFVFLIGLVVMYSGPVAAAIRNKKDNKIKDDRASRDARRLPEKKPGEPFYRHNSETPLEEQPKIEKVFEEIKVPMKKRKQGKQAKAF